MERAADRRQAVGHAVSDLPPDAADSGAHAYLNKERFGAELLRRLWADRGPGSFQTT